jgi:transposase
LDKRLISELTRELERLRLINSQIKEVERERDTRLKEETSPLIQKTLKLARLRGIGPVFSWNLVFEFLWRHFDNVKQVGAAAGLTPSAYQSGELRHDLGISKAGNRKIRTLMVELSWLWLRYQPESDLSKWFNERFGSGSRRSRKIGIVALARKLLISLWKYLEKDSIPAGAELKA